MKSIKPKTVGFNKEPGFVTRQPSIKKERDLKDSSFNDAFEKIWPELLDNWCIKPEIKGSISLREVTHEKARLAINSVSPKVH